MAVPAASIAAGLGHRRRRKTPRWGCSLLFRALAGCVALAVASASMQRGAGFAAVRLPAGVKRTFVPKGQKIGEKKEAVVRVNPKLKGVLESQDYRDFIDMLVRLREENCLQEFSNNLYNYFERRDIFKMSEESQSVIVKQLRKDWEQIWPKKLSSIRVDAFERSLGFWEITAQASLGNLVLQEVLPDFMGRKGPSNDVQALRDLTEEEHLEEITRRLSNAQLIKQFALLSQDDEDVQSVTPEVASFFCRVVSSFEKQLATKAFAAGEYATEILIALLVAGLAFGLYTLGWAPSLPFSDDAPPPPLDQPLPEKRYYLEVMEQVERQQLAEQSGAVAAAPEEQPKVEAAAPEEQPKVEAAAPEAQPKS